MAVLVYSTRCDHSKAILGYIKTQPVLLNMVKFHNVNTQGVPKGITRVPTLITDDGKTIVGGDVKPYLSEFIPIELESSSLSSRLDGCFLDGTGNDSDMFSLDSYGMPLAPPMTADLEEKISRNVSDAYQSLKK